MKRRVSWLALCIVVFLSSASLWQPSHVRALETIPDPQPAGCDGTRCVFYAAQSADDAGQAPDTCTNNSASITLPEIYFGQCDNGNDITSGFRFPNVTIPYQASISKAYLWFVEDGPYNTEVMASIYVENSTNATVFSTSSPPSSRSVISSPNITWDITPTWQLGERVSSPDIHNVIQPIINKNGWATGNALSLIVKKKTSTSAVPPYRRVLSYDRADHPGLGARLVVYLKAPTMGYAQYVRNSWNTKVSYYGQIRTQAFKNGSQANAGYGHIVLLAFGHQVGPNDILHSTQAPANAWGIETTIPEQKYFNNTWVISIANEFAAGYDFGRSQPGSPHYGALPTTIVVGTSTDHFQWQCSTASPVLDSAYWSQGGQQWAIIINSINGGSNTIISGNDIESFGGDSCASGPEQWFDGFEYGTSALNLNFGDFALGKTGWPTTTDGISDFYAVSWTRTSAITAPEIYCDGNPSQWANFSIAHPIYFHGVTSGNGGLGPGGQNGMCVGSNPNTYTSGEAWSALYSAMNTQNVGTIHKLAPMVIGGFN